MRLNVPIVGFIIGVFFPVVGFLITKFIFFRHDTLSSVVTSLAHNHKDAAKVLTLSILINLLPFLYFMKRRLDYTMNGVVVATMLYSVLIVLIMFVW